MSSADFFYPAGKELQSGFCGYSKVKALVFLTLTNLGANSADDKLIFFLIFPRAFMQTSPYEIVCMILPISYFWEK